MTDKKKNRGGYKSNTSLDEKVMMSIVRTSELFKKRIAILFQDHGLTFPQYNVLRILDASPAGQNTITNVSRMMLVSGANMTGIAKRLEKNGFLIRRGDVSDERITLLEITGKGKESLKKIHKDKEANLKQFVKYNSSTVKKEDLLAALKQISQMMLEQ